jgi:translocation protein SEC66
VVDVVAEANTFKQGWGQWIFASASEIAQREKLKGVLEEMPKIKQEQGERFPQYAAFQLTRRDVDRIYASIKAKHQAPAPPPPYTATASSTPQATSIPAGKATSTALESPTEGLVHRAAASVGAEKADEEISSGASTPQKGGATSGKVCRRYLLARS